MKKYFIVLFVLTTIVFNSNNSYSQGFANAVDYLAYINEKQHDIAEDMWAYMSASAHTNRDRKINRKKRALLQTIQQTKTDVSRMPDYNGSTALRDSMVAYLDFSAKLLNGDLTEMEALEFDAKNSYSAMKAYLDKVKQVNQKYADHENRLMTEYEQFAAINNIQLNPNSSQLSAKMATARIVKDYYNNVYMIYFKAAIAENFINKAINDNDTTALKSWTDSLNTAITDGEIGIKQVNIYNGDLSLKFACQKALNSFKLEANTYLPKLLDYYRAETKLNTAKANFDSKSQDQITQADVDTYNNAVNDYNNAIEIYNEYTEKINKLQEDNLKQWNDVSDKFFDQHVPK